MDVDVEPGGNWLVCDTGVSVGGVRAHHSLYSSFHTALYPSGTFGGGGPLGGKNSLMMFIMWKVDEVGISGWCFDGVASSGKPLMY